MTAKEKALTLIDTFYLNKTEGVSYSQAKACALICVHEVMKVAPYVKKYPHLFNHECVEYWEEVKQELEKL